MSVLHVADATAAAAADAAAAGAAVAVTLIAAVSLTAFLALRGTRPAQRPEILRALAEFVTALRGGPRSPGAGRGRRGPGR